MVTFKFSCQNKIPEFCEQLWQQLLSQEIGKLLLLRLPGNIASGLGLGMSVAGVLLTLETSMFRIVEFDDKSLDGLPSLFYGNQHTSTAVGQPIQGVDVVDQDDVAPNLSLIHI